MEDSNLFQEISLMSKSQILGSTNLDEIINEIGFRICNCLKLERVNIWLYSEERDFIRSIGELSNFGKKFAKGSILFEKNMPHYFSHLKTDEILVVNNVNENEITKELKLDYCNKNNIVSLMDVPLRIEGKMVGVICFEHTKIIKYWTEAEQKFALSGAQIISLAIETKQRRRVQASLEKELLEKNMLIKESHHRIKNNFAILISLLRLRANTPTKENLKDVLEDCINRIFSIMKVHEQLYRTNGYSIVQLEPYIKELAREIQYSVNNIYKKIKIEVDIDDINVKSSTAIYLGLFLNEVLTNSIKYSYNEEANLIIKISVTKDSHNLVFTINDNGIGFSYADNFSEETIGLAILEDITKSLDGKLITPIVGQHKYELSFSDVL